jgi:hypothetical protein
MKVWTVVLEVKDKNSLYTEDMIHASIEMRLTTYLEHSLRFDIMEVIGAPYGPVAKATKNSEI